MSPSPGHTPVSICIGFSYKFCDDSLLAQVAPDFSPKSSIILLPLSPHVLSPSCCCCPANGMVVGGENVHCTENVRPLLGLGKQSLH